MGWDYIESTPAHGDLEYQVVAPTPADSSVLGLNRTSYLIRAATSNPSVYYDSAPDSGYSVDNLSVSVPSPFTAVYLPGAMHLHWGANTESDFWYYNLYRGTSASFVPSAANRIASQADTGYVDVGPAGGYYKLSAANLSGIESGYALLGPGQTLGADDALPKVVELAEPMPNPAHGATSLRFGLPSNARVSLTIFDVSGRLVRSLANGAYGAGEHAMSWDLRNESGSTVGGGIYFARLEAGGIARTRRFAVTR